MKRIKITKSITSRATPALEVYLKEVSKMRLISPEEEIKLVQQIRQGDTCALEILVKANLRFVISVAKQYQSGGLTFSDLINEGNLGLMKAAERFDETKGFKFISYAVWWIRQSILQALAEHGRIVRLPQHKVGYLNKINRVYSSLEQELEREPSADEMALLVGIETEEVETMLGLAGRSVSFDAPFSRSDDREVTLLDMKEDTGIEPTDHALSHYESLRTEVSNALASLKEKQSEVLKLYFGIGGGAPLSLYDISLKLNLSSERIRQIKDEGMNLLKARSKTSLRAYLSA